ncbi:hypothetical protein WN48_09044 [Eufriesea mexicana]|uniref:Uncharacterized protein n=1 Tax=Eufriesea mexicana TaxID=516756 RepID=A0A310SJ59_9HYME|nr:hypothetical protein WN48_09044 [Eufriesea mexicana]
MQGRSYFKKNKLLHPGQRVAVEWNNPILCTMIGKWRSHTRMKTTKKEERREAMNVQQ